MRLNFIGFKDLNRFKGEGKTEREIKLEINSLESVDIGNIKIF